MSDRNVAGFYVDEPEKSIDFKYYFFLIRKNLTLLMTFFILVMTLGGIVILKLPNQYLAKSQIIIEKPAKSSMANSDQRMDDSSSSEAWSEDYYTTQVEIMKSTTILKQVIKELKMEGIFDALNPDKNEQAIREMIDVQRIKSSRLFDIVVTSSDAEQAANIANSIAKAYVKKNFEDSLYYSKEILAWLPKEGEGDLVSVTDPFGNIKQVSRESLIDNLPAIQTDSTIRNLKEKKSSLEAELQVLLRQYREKHPVIIKARAQLKFLEDSVDQEKKRIIDHFKTQAQGTLQSSFSRVVEEAAIPKAPIGPNRLRLFLILAIGQLLLSVALVVLRDYFDDTIHAMEDLERKGIVIPFLGPIPIHRNRKGDIHQRTLVAYYDRDSDITESFRYLRVAINFSASPDSLKCLVISSCLPHEGKSFVSHNTAISLAMDGNDTLLVDCDLRRPVVHRNFKLDNSVGMTNYLTSNLAFDTVLKKTFVDKLTIVTAGPISPNPSEILASHRMTEFLDEARKRFDRIIIDCPPLTAIGDGYVVGSMIGHIIMIVAANKTPADLIRRIQQQIDKAGIKILGLVLNQVNFDKERLGGYSKHYYHTYSRYYRRSARESA